MIDVIFISFVRSSCSGTNEKTPMALDATGDYFVTYNPSNLTR